MVGTIHMKSKIYAHKNMLKITIFTMISLIILSGSIVVPVSAATTTVKVNPATQTVSTGSTFTVSVLCVPGQSIKSYELKVAFNPNLLKVNSVSKGTIFNGYTTYFNAGTIDNTAGTIKNIYNVILGTGTVSSSGTFITISFTAKSTAGTSSINLNNVGVTNSVGYIPIAITNGSVQVTVQSNAAPIYETTSPTNKSTNVPISTASLNIAIKDPNGDSFNYTIQTQPNIGSVSVKGTHDGTKQCTISGLKYGTTYRWYVNTTDGKTWKRSWYQFTTVSAPTNSLFSISGILPNNGSRNIDISTTTLSVTIQNSKGHPFTYYMKTNPKIGSSSGVNKYNGSKTCSISALDYSTTYYWYVQCKDQTTGQWVNKTYWFTTESNNPGGSGGGDGGGSSSSDNDTPVIENAPPETPTIPFGAAYIQNGTVTYYTASSFDPDNDSIQLLFDWGDGTDSDWTSYISSNVSVSMPHAWTNVLTYNISVMAQDEHGLNSSWSDPYMVIVSQINDDQAIIAIVTSSDNITTNESVLFDASYCYVPDSTIVSYEWEFGDGKKSSGKKTAYSYEAPGEYEVTLTVTDTQGETYNNKITVTVATGAKVFAQDSVGGLLSILLTSGLIGVVIILITILIFLARGTVFLQIGKKYLTYGYKWIRHLVSEVADLRHSKPTKHESKPKKTISHTKQSKPVKPMVHHKLLDNYDTIDDILMQKIHDKIDSL